LTLCSVSPPTSRPTTFPYATLFRSESESQEALPESSGWYADSRLQGRGQFPGVLRQQHLLHSWQTGRRFEATGYGKQRMCLPELLHPIHSVVPPYLDAILTRRSRRNFLDNGFLVGNGSVVILIRFLFYCVLCVLFIPGGTVYGLNGFIVAVCGSHILIR